MMVMPVGMMNVSSMAQTQRSDITDGTQGAQPTNSQGTNAVCTITGVQDCKAVSNIHEIKMVEATKKTTQIDGVKNVKSLYNQSASVIGRDFYTTYFGINLVEHKKTP